MYVPLYFKNDTEFGCSYQKVKIAPEISIADMKVTQSPSFGIKFYLGVETKVIKQSAWFPDINVLGRCA